MQNTARAQHSPRFTEKFDRENTDPIVGSSPNREKRLILFSLTNEFNVLNTYPLMSTGSKKISAQHSLSLTL